ncbi:hypothetical protein E2C01_045920 [Portunus trituberculatus]|uniref:Uncharacterized protein n=1 Tax=Portunus trituberculatus TaxID=210409 RepID=A0A5B7FWE7_PORTR|nr:hypothetical protein [Portunus trituberculatus]
MRQQQQQQQQRRGARQPPAPARWSGTQLVRLPLRPDPSHAAASDGSARHPRRSCLAAAGPQPPSCRQTGSQALSFYLFLPHALVYHCSHPGSCLCVCVSRFFLRDPRPAHRVVTQCPGRCRAVTPRLRALATGAVSVAARRGEAGVLLSGCLRPW